MIITGMLPHPVADEIIHFSAQGIILILPRCIDDLQASDPLYSSICGLFLVYTSVRNQYYSQSKQKRARRACPQGHNAESSRVCTLCEFPIYLHHALRSVPAALLCPSRGVEKQQHGVQFEPSCYHVKNEHYLGAVGEKRKIPRGPHL